MSKREDIDQLKRDFATLSVMQEAYHKSVSSLYHRCGLLEDQVKELQKQVTNLLEVATRQKPDPLALIGPTPEARQKTIEQIQDDWAKRNLGILSKGPLPYAHKSGNEVNMRVE